LLILITITILTVPTQQAVQAQVNSSLNDIIVSKSGMQEFSVPFGSRPHDVAPGKNGTVWYTSQGSGELGLLDPSTVKSRQIALGQGSAPHGVIVGPDGAPWVTYGGLNAIVRVDLKMTRLVYFHYQKVLAMQTRLRLIKVESSGLLARAEYMVN